MVPPSKTYDPSQPFLAKIQKAVARTREAKSPYIQFRPDGSYVESTDHPRRDSSDTIGTKAVLHWQSRTFRAAAQDAFAMNANDLYRDRAIPYKLLNTIMIERDDVETIAELIAGLADLSIERGIQMGDGETAILDKVEGFELGVSMTGVVTDNHPNRYQAGDVLVGIPSSGIHSNGLSDARRLFGEDIPNELRTPTRIYDEVPKLLSAVEIHGLTHVTGGGFSKLQQPDVDMYIDIRQVESVSSIFDEIYDRWVSEAEEETADLEMHLKFNNGIGFVLGASAEEARRIQGIVPEAEVIGEVTAGTGAVIVQSRYSGRRIRL